MIIFPLRTDRRLTSTPWVNYALIAVNVLIFLFTERQINDFYQLANAGASMQQLFAQTPIVRYFLWPDDPHVYQFITYQFLHAGKMHIFFNMIFLYVFGNGVEDRLGKVGYLFFYLAAGVFAAVGQAAIDPSPILGASGSIAGVTGAYLALFPLSYVTVFYIFDTFEISSIVLILFRVGQDALMQLMGHQGVAYLAHLSGYACGFVVCMGLLLGRLLPREPYDMLALIEQRRRRAQFQRLARGGFHAWESAPKSVPQKDADDASGSAEDQDQIMALRGKVNEALSRHDLPGAARLYAELLERDPRQVMAQPQQLDLANQLMSESRYAAAAAAYELLLDSYPAYGERQHVQLVLGLIFARYLEQTDRAKELLTDAMPHLDGEDKQLAKTVLGEID